MLRCSGLVTAVSVSALLLLDAGQYAPAWAQNYQAGPNTSGGTTPPTLGAPPALHDSTTATATQRLAAVPPNEPAGRATQTEYRLGPGDRVRINVFGQQDLTGLYTVDGTGNLQFPLIGKIRAGGMTGAELQEALIGKLSPEYIKEPSVSVEVVSYRPFYILGEVRTPGSYSYVTGITALEAIAIAGGFTYRAREGDFTVTRTAPDGGKQHLDVLPDTEIEPGDVITVRERYF